MMNVSENSFTGTNMGKTLKVKTEPIEEEAEEILPDLPEPLVHVKSEHCEATPDNVNYRINQENSGIQVNNSNSLLNKTLIKIDGVFYYLEKIPETLIQKPQTENILPQVQKRVFHTPATCPKCGKTLKQTRNLKRHMQVCYNTCTFTCKKCNYTTASGHYWLLHSKQCGRPNPPPTQRIDRKVNCLCICLTCNTSTLLHSENCSECGSKNLWQCKICSLTFQTWAKARRHLRTKCKADSYYHCRICDYKQVLRYYVQRHILKTHPECKPCANFICKQKILNDANTSQHICSLCNKQFEDAIGLNRHTFLCQKYQFYSRGKWEKIKSNNGVSQPDLSSILERKGYRQIIVRHCKTCNEDIELENHGYTLKKSCVNCLSILIYKCKKCGKLHWLYDSLVKHVKATCNREEQFKCVQCDYVGYSFNHLTEHYKTHGDISATCTNCGSFFTNSNFFKKHIKRCGLTTTLYCDMCPYKSITKRSLIRHMRDHDTPGSALSNSINNLDSHFANKCQSNISGIQPYCRGCSRHQTTNHRLKICKLCNNELQFRCSRCNKMYSIGDLDVCEHVKNYLELLSLECKSCGKRFSNKDKYKLHENSCWKIKYYRCKLCSYYTRYETYFRLHNRKAHQISYRGGRLQNENDSQELEMKIIKVLHLCQYCSYETRTKASLQKHLKIHLAENGGSNSISHQKSDKEMSSNTFDGDSKLNLQCKVVLTRLDINSV